ncbi:MAG: hypothetical protein GX074_01500 [Erysipelothrix sp.]|nr:hypothetical protein [Erysipelothrix sp.]
MIVLQNEDFYVKIDLKGGQIARMKHEISGREYIFEADPQYWAYSTPTLFPIIGSSHDKKYHFGKQVTTMENHGFLRQAHFLNTYTYDNEVVLTFSANEETLKQYPFYFKINLSYKLIGNKIKVEYDIINDGVVDMPFNFGLHPAFNLPLSKDKKFEDYKLTFSSAEVLKGHGPMVNAGLVKEIPLSYDLFEEYPTWVYHNVSSAKVGYSDGEHGVNVSVVGFPIVAVWTNAAKQAPFICIEPWLGVGHKTDKDLEFEQRDAVMNIKPETSFKVSYTIEVF